MVIRDCNNNLKMGGKFIAKRHSGQVKYSLEKDNIKITQAKLFKTATHLY